MASPCATIPASQASVLAEQQCFDEHVRRFLSLVDRTRLRSVLRYLLEEEFFSPYGIRSLSRYHKDHPNVLNAMGHENRVDYEPAESSSGLFGGNSNWRGPVWFPVNYLLVESLQKFHYFLGDQYKVESPTGSGHHLTRWQIAGDISRRLMRIFLKDTERKRPAFRCANRFKDDPYWQHHVLFYEYFHGDNGAGIGASHQTVWAGLVPKLIQQSGE